MPGARALLLIVLAALLTVLAGPSAAVYAEPTDAGTASVAGIAPNGADATPRVGHLVPPLPSVVPVDAITLPPPVRAGGTVRPSVPVTTAAPATSQHDRAPPVS